MDTSKLRIVVFDAYGTLFNINSIDSRLEVHFGNQAEEIGLLWRKKQLEYTWLRTLMDRYEPFTTVTAEALEFSCNHLQLDLDPVVLTDLMEHYNVLSAYPEVGSSLEQLSQKYQLGILSNANHEMLTAAVDFNQLGRYLSRVISVDSIERYKPHPDVYSLVTREFKVDQQEVIFVSSNTWDVSGAKAFGLNAAWLKRGAGTMETMRFDPDLEVENLTDLVNI